MAEYSTWRGTPTPVQSGWGSGTPTSGGTSWSGGGSTSGNTTQAWLDYYAGQGMRITPELQAYAEAYGNLGKQPPVNNTPGDFLSGEQKNAFAALRQIFGEYDLEELTNDILMYLREGYDGDTIELLLRETEAYKKRFAANDVRQKAGLSTLSPAEYIALERQYAQVMRLNGMPTGFYDQREDFTNWIAGDVSVQEVQARVAGAKRAAYDIPQEAADALYEFYGVKRDEVAAYFLDEKRALPILEQQLAASEVAGGAKAAGFTTSESRARELVGLGVDARQAREGYMQIADVMPQAERLSNIYADEGKYDLAAAESEVFQTKGGAEASKTRRGLASRERAAFSGQSGTTRGSLSRNRPGQV
jgi:hypothetical protein